MRRPWVSLTGMLVLLIVSTVSQAGEVTIAVAANFTEVTRELAARFTRQTGYRTRISFGSTGKLYAQIEHGAPFEVFLAADSERPQMAEANGLGVPGTRFTYASGKLVLWSPQPHLFTDGRKYLTDARLRHLAIANPRTAPYGRAAQQVLMKLQVWHPLQAKLVRGDSISQTFQFTATGNAEAGLVALSQVRGWHAQHGTSWQIPAHYHAPIRQQAILLTRGEHNPAARAWLAYLRSEPARELIHNYGYDTE
ncbi:molybdate ABC transporter substrate-binding protein [Marinobacter sp. X15-166B]|uniref:molybdate ABC transporter substrate-binding protein n=1 Tax=Marinobacter sp. X15-166B TaxID=1897620 RepID=UPI00085BC992|nr:molybdate ABC transporter substrate-binding protein [Marinobacter sp. X15-166B]OEY65730.1 molybdate ABC transporter substrate-binding protein [Marinobacter sp. X15-166B]